MPVLKRKAVTKTVNPPSPPAYVPPMFLQARETTDANDKIAQTSSTQSKASGKKKKKPIVDKMNRYEELRLMSDGIIHEDPEQGGIKDRTAIIERFGLRDANDAIAPSVRISFSQCLVDKDADMEEATGCQVALVRGTTSTQEYKEKFLENGWDGQYAGMATIHVTPEVVKILGQKSAREQDAWLLLPNTLAKYMHYIIDGAHRVELGVEHAEEKAMQRGGLFELVHPSMPFRTREHVALGSNVLSENVNKTLLLDKMLYIKKQLQYKAKVTDMVERLGGCWGEAGAVSQMLQCTKLMNRKAWEALSEDYRSLGFSNKTDPLFTITLMLSPVFKTTPEYLRGEIMMDMVMRSKTTGMYPGSNAKTNKPKGREQALWIATVWAIIRYEVGLGKASKTRIGSMNEQELQDVKARFEDEEVCDVIGRAVGVGDLKAYEAPTVGRKKINVTNAVQAVAAVVSQLLGVGGEGEEKVEGVVEAPENTKMKVNEEYKEQPVTLNSLPVVYLADSTQAATWSKVQRALEAIAKDHDVTRVHVVTSPPWGVLTGHEFEGQDDVAMTPTQISEVNNTKQDEVEGEVGGRIRCR